MRFLFLLSLLFFSRLSPYVFADEPAWGESPYRVRIYVFSSERNRLPEGLFETIRRRCEVYWGNYWIVQVVEPSVELRDRLRTEFAESADLPDDWKTLDKIFAADFSSDHLQLREFDTATNWLGKKITLPLEDVAKTDDMLIRGLRDVFSPLGRVEQSTEDFATLSIRGKNLLHDSRSIRNLDVFLPFVCVLDRSSRLTHVNRIPWTVLSAESDGEPEHRGLRCRVESGVRAPLSSRRRGRTEIYALAVPTPPISTTLHFVSRSADTAAQTGTLPIYDVYEKIPGEKEAASIGRTTVDGIFLLEPSADRAVRTLQIRDGNTLIAKFPIIRGLESETRIPVPDDAVRLEAEAALLGIQEEMIDQVARRDILKLRARKFEEQGDKQKARDVHGELLRMKDADRYHLELNQLRERLRSADPIVERRINRLFKDTRKMVDAFLK